MSHAQQNRKAPSQPTSGKADTAGTAKKARSTRSNSTNKRKSGNASDNYAMGSYDNEPVEEPVSTPSWVRSNSQDMSDAHAIGPSSPMAPSQPLYSPNGTTPAGSRSNLIAPVPFHMPPFAPTANPGLVPNPANPFAIAPSGPPGLAPMPLVPSNTMPNAMNNSGSTMPAPFGVNPMMPSPFAQGFASAPPSFSNPSTLPGPAKTNQDAIARILALQQQTSTMSGPMGPMSTSTTPATSTASNAPPAALSLAPSPFGAPQAPFASAASSPFPNTKPASTPYGGNPFGAPTAGPPGLSNGAPQPFFVSPAPDNPASLSAPPQSPMKPSTTSTPISLDHLMSMQQQNDQQKLFMEQFKKSASSTPASAAPIDPLLQLQQQIKSGQAARTSPAVAPEQAYETSPTTRAKNAKNAYNGARNTAPLYAHHNYGVPAQP